MKLSLLKRNTETPVKMPLVHPVMGDLGAHLMILPPGHKRQRVAIETYQRLNAELDKEAADNPKRYDADELESKREEIAIGLSMGIIVGWGGLECDDGEPMKFTEEALSSILSEPGYGWIATRVLTFLGDDKQFFPADVGADAVGKASRVAGNSSRKAK